MTLRSVVAFLVGTLGLVPASVLAGTADAAQIYNPYAMSTGVILFYDAGTRHSPPACATETGRFALNGSTAAGQARLSLLLSAYLSHKPITVYGTGTCADWGDTESVDFFAVIG